MNLAIKFVKEVREVLPTDYNYVVITNEHKPSVTSSDIYELDDLAGLEDEDLQDLVADALWWDFVYEYAKH